MRTGDAEWVGPSPPALPGTLSPREHWKRWLSAGRAGTRGLCGGRRMCRASPLSAVGEHRATAHAASQRAPPASLPSGSLAFPFAPRPRPLCLSRRGEKVAGRPDEGESSRQSSRRRVSDEGPVFPPLCPPCPLCNACPSCSQGTLNGSAPHPLSITPL
jgi:hypothetical protein